MIEKTCTKCGIMKTEDNFYFQSKKHNIRQCHCKDCARQAQKKWRDKNKSSIRAYAREDYKKRIIESEGRLPRSRGDNHIPSSRSNAVFKRNKHLENFFRNLPLEIQSACEEFYRICNAMNKYAGKRTYHVDHIIPINGENISGLHVPWNLRITFTSENASKGNRLIPDYWGDSTPTNIEDYVHDESTLPTFIDWEKARWPLGK